jgi:predicted transposase YdaD
MFESRSTQLRLLPKLPAICLECLKDRKLLTLSSSESVLSEAMPIIIDVRKTLLYKEAKAEGKAEAKVELAEAKKSFARYLLQNTNKTVKEIAEALGITIQFVKQVKNNKVTNV